MDGERGRMRDRYQSTTLKDVTETFSLSLVAVSLMGGAAEWFSPPTSGAPVTTLVAIYCFPLGFLRFVRGQKVWTRFLCTTFVRYRRRKYLMGTKDRYDVLSTYIYSRTGVSRRIWNELHENYFTYPAKTLYTRRKCKILFGKIARYYSGRYSKLLFEKI